MVTSVGMYRCIFSDVEMPSGFGGHNHTYVGKPHFLHFYASITDTVLLRSRHGVMFNQQANKQTRARSRCKHDPHPTKRRSQRLA